MNSYSEKESSEQPPSLTSPLEKGFEKIVTPFHHFIRDQTVTSAMLVVSMLLALILANSPLTNEYYAFFETDVGLNFGDYTLEMTIHHWINDGLMALFFFIIGLEIKREILVGELSQPGRTFPVIMAASGGMLLPAIIYTSINYGTGTSHGWGIPMATDTAFVIGILALLRGYVPAALVAFVTALAIIDDIGAIVVIAIFYTESINMTALVNGMIVLAVMALINILGVRQPSPYFILGGLLWFAMLESGVHPTLAGILAAMVVPSRPRLSPGWFVRRTKTLINSFENKEMDKEEQETILSDDEQHEIVEKIHSVADKASTPLQRWESSLEQPVTLLVLPVFAFANAGIPVDMSVITQLLTPLSMGIIAGLVIGKVLGISLMTWCIIRFTRASLADNVTLSHVIGIGLLAGMGFTMAIFVANLGFSSSPEDLAAAKAAILVSSFIAGISGYAWLRRLGSRKALI